MAPMQPSPAPASNRLEERIAALKDDRTVGRLVRLYPHRREQILYLVVGGWNTVFGYGVWALMQFVLGDHLHYLVIVLLSWPIAVLNAYLGYRYIVFRSRGPLLRELPRFSTVYVATLLAPLVVLPLALAVLPFSIYVINGAFTCVVVVASYLAHRHFSFGGGRHAVGSPH